MKTTNNTIMILFGMAVVGTLALIPVSILISSLYAPKQVEPENSMATVQAAVTQTVYAWTVNAPTQTPVPPATATAIPATNTPVPTSTKVVVTYCDWVAFVKDVTIPDGTILVPGESFNKTWRLKNRGTCAWTSDYMLVFSGGSQMGGTTSVRIPGTVLPGQTVDISIQLTAPSVTGGFTGYWMLRNPQGALFATGEKANTPFYVDIVVKTPIDELPHGTVTGSLCYPSEFNPPMTLYFEKAGTTEQIQFAIPEAQNNYSVLLPKGTYYVYAWAPGYNLEGAYTDSNSLMKTFVVRGGQTTYNINLCDWSPYSHARGQ